MRRLSALERLARGLREAPHEYRPSLQVFPDLSVDALAREMDLGAKGAERGRLNEPDAQSTTFDDLEHSIVERIHAERKLAYQELIDQLETYSRRLGALDFEGRFSTIQYAAPAAVGEFKAEAFQGRDELYKLRRTLVENEQERESFRKMHGLVRAPRVSTGTGTFLKVSLLVFLFVAETYINGTFLAKGSELGLLGGVVEATVFAVLNVVVSFFVGLIGVRQINSAGALRKTIGVLSIGFWACFAVGLNLALAHYREVSGVLYEDAGLQVIKNLMAVPFGLTDIKSWLFFSLGFVFSAVALGDGIIFTDPCPGYASLEKRVRHAHEDYTSYKNSLIADLMEIRDDAIARMEETARDLGKRRGEHDAIISGRTRLISLFQQHQEQLSQAGNALLAKYRAANQQARSSPRPARFNEPWTMERMRADAELPQSLVLKNLSQRIDETNDLLKAEISSIHRAFDEAVESYRQIDDLLPEEPYVPAKHTRS